MKKIKAMLSILISLMLIICTCAPAFAASDDCGCGTAPVIQVRGIGETLYDGEGNEIFSTDNIINGILPVIPDLAQFLLTDDTSLFVNAVTTAVNTIFEPVMYNNNGERDKVVQVKNFSSDPVETYMDFSGEMGSEQTLAKMLYDEMGNNHSYLFIYDWTANPFDIAEDLNEFIQEVKEKSGHDKVSICAESMGGAITNTYFALYGFGDVKNVVMSNSAFNGLEMLGQLFIGNPEIDGEALAELISQSIRGSAEYSSLLAYLPIFEQLALRANDIFAEAGPEIYENVLIPVFGYIPSFWCFIPEYHFEEAMDFMLQDAGYKYKTTISLYYNLVVKGTDLRVSTMVNSRSINYACVSNYNRYIAPVTPSAQWNSDGVIETYNTSGFATVADMDTTLGDGYTQAKNTGKDMISPDNVVDASTCQAPFNTWFIKNLGHIAYGTDDGTGDFYVWLLTNQSQYNIETNSKYPQFMYYDTEIPMLMPYPTEEPEVDDGILGAIGGVLDNFFPDGNIEDGILGDLLPEIGGGEGGLDIDIPGGDLISGIIGSLFPSGDGDIPDTFNGDYEWLIVMELGVTALVTAFAVLFIKKKREEISE